MASGQYWTDVVTVDRKARLRFTARTTREYVKRQDPPPDRLVPLKWRRAIDLDTGSDLQAWVLVGPAASPAASADAWIISPWEVEARVEESDECLDLSALILPITLTPHTAGTTFVVPFMARALRWLPATEETAIVRVDRYGLAIWTVPAFERHFSR